MLSNPMRGLPSPASNRTLRVNHRVNRRLWQRIQDTLDQIEPADMVDYRTVFAIRFFYLTGLCLSELCALRMEDVLAQENDTGDVAWYLNVLGKGGRIRQVYLVKPAWAALPTYLVTVDLNKDTRLNDLDDAIISYRKWQKGLMAGQGCM